MLIWNRIFSYFWIQTDRVDPMKIGVKKAMNVGATLHNRECLLLPRLNERGSIQFHRGCTFSLAKEYFPL